ncbi:hypothetical protein [Streptomyces lutosisoli]|uniref:ATPase AAA-type core domain-containing protein n=1 Tax=Streptomyces lutosisoli TaxID=2665721 RepID=A0ABW2VVH1_9ACTN
MRVRRHRAGPGRRLPRRGGGGREAGLADGRTRIRDYIRLGPLDTALLPYRLPRVLLIDELDKNDIELPNDLLNIIEEGEYDIPELVRNASREPEAEVSTAGPGATSRIGGGRAAVPSP